MRHVLPLLSCLLLAFDWPGRVERLLQELESASSEAAQRDVIRLLGGLDDPAARAALTKAAFDPRPQMRIEALSALAQSGDERAAEPALAALKDADSSVRVAAVGALGVLRPKDATRLLARSLADSDARVRIESARALGAVGEAEAVPALAAALDDTSTEVRVSVVRALAKIGDARALGPLVSKARDSSPELRKAVVESLAELGDQRAFGTFAQALEDSNDAVVLAALRAVARLDPATWQPRVVELTQSPHPRIQAAAAAALARSRRRDRKAGRAEASVGVTKGEGRPWLAPLERTVHADADEAARLVEELERTIPLGEPLVADPLLQWLDRAPLAQRARIVHLVARSGETSAAPRLLAHLASSPPALKIAIFEAAGVLAEPRSADALLPWLTTPNPLLRDAVARALSHVASAPQLPILQGHLDHRELATRRAAALVIRGVLLRNDVPAATQDALVASLSRALDTPDEALFALVVRCLGLVRANEAALLALQRVHDLGDPARTLAVVRAASGIHRQSKVARGLRNADADAPPEVVATSLAARALAQDPLDAAQTVALVRSSRWPVGPMAAFALAHAARRPGGAALAPQLCELLDAREPFTRANLVAALASVPSAACLDTQGLRWLAESRSVAVRVAAARWARARSTIVQGDRHQRALERCAQEDPAAIVRDACGGRRSDLAENVPTNDVRGVLLDDGSVLVSFPDAAHDVTWPRARSVGVESPWRVPYGYE